MLFVSKAGCLTKRELDAKVLTYQLPVVRRVPQGEHPRDGAGEDGRKRRNPEEALGRILEVNVIERKCTEKPPAPRNEEIARGMDVGIDCRVADSRRPSTIELGVGVAPVWCHVSQYRTHRTTGRQPEANDQTESKLPYAYCRRLGGHKRS